MASDGPGVRKVRGESSAGDSPELPPLSKSLGIRNKLIPDPELCTMIGGQCNAQDCFRPMYLYSKFEGMRIGLS